MPIQPPVMLLLFTRYELPEPNETVIPVVLDTEALSTHMPSITVPLPVRAIAMGRLAVATVMPDEQALVGVEANPTPRSSPCRRTPLSVMPLVILYLCPK